MKQTEAVAAAASLFACLEDEAFARATDDALWSEISRVLNLQTKPPDLCTYRHFVNRILTPGIPGGAVPVESFYVPWSELPGAEGGGGKRRYLSDHALHVQKLCNSLGINIPTEFQAMPDHLSLLCELWAFLDEHAPARDASAFARDHLTWIASYRATLEDRAANNSDQQLIAAYEFYQDLATAIEKAVQSMTKEGEQRE